MLLDILLDAESIGITSELGAERLACQGEEVDAEVLRDWGQIRSYHVHKPGNA